MNRAQQILEIFGGSNLRLQKDQNYLKCQSCGYIASFPSGVYGTDGLGDTTRAPLFGESKKKNKNKCPKCGGPMNEVNFSPSRVWGSSGLSQGTATPGGAYQGGAYY